MAYVEQLPGECPNGHVFRDWGSVLAGWLPCNCTIESIGVMGHCTVRCLVCEITWCDPAHDGRDWIPHDKLRTSDGWRP